MADRSHTILNLVPVLIDWGTFRDRLVVELTQAGYTGHEATIYSQFSPDHFHYMDQLADLISQAIDPHPEIDSLLRSQNSRLEMMLAINSTRDLLESAGSFDSSTGWTVETGWTIGSGVATASIPDGSYNNIIYPLSGLTSGTRYLFEFDILTYNSGGCNPRIFGSENLDGEKQDSAGSKQVVMSSGGAPTSVAIGVAQAGGFDGVIDNFKLRKLGG